MNLHNPEPGKLEQSEHISFVSLGMVILDELYLPDGKILYDVAGGSGLYSTLGARIVTEAGLSKRVGCIVLAGSDFPESVAEALGEWDITLRIARDNARLSTRGQLKYPTDGFNKAVFKLVTPPLQPTPADLDGSSLLRSTAFHFLASPELLQRLLSELMDTRTARGISSRPLLVWEPHPASCVAANQAAQLQAAKLVDVYSPNHTELLRMFPNANTALPSSFDPAIIEEQAQRILQSGVGINGEGAVVARCGEHGSLVNSRSYGARWFPALHQDNLDRVVDATGAGNTFLGGFTVKLGETGDLSEAVIAATVAASFAIEQVGLAQRACLHGEETWNGEHFSVRDQKYRAVTEL